MIDGASPMRVLWSVIIPQSYPALMAITVFHIVFAWNDYFGPLIYLSTAHEKWPISIALSTFNGIYGQKPQLIQAGALMALIAPRIAQRDRHYERNMERGYIDTLNRAYEDFFANLQPGPNGRAVPVLALDTNELDYIRRPEHLRLVEDRIRQALQLPPYQPELFLDDSHAYHA